MNVKQFLKSRTGAVVAGTALLATLGGMGSAVAGSLVTSADIKDGTVKSVDLKDGGVARVDLALGSVGYDQLGDKVATAIKTGSISGLEADGPYPGVTHLQQGDNSTSLWVADEGATLQTSWVMCAPGKYALGGGFSHADESVEAIHGLQIVSSRAATYANGVETSPGIPGDPDGSIRPNAWVVEGFNNGTTTDLIVRPWVVCASIN